MIPALIIFIITYILMIALPKWRVWVALASAFIFVVSGLLPINKLFPSIDFNVILMIAGTMGTVSLAIESKMPSLLADIILSKVKSVKWVIFVLAVFAGIVSAFIDNVATVLMIAPIALSIAKKLDINPVGMIIAIAVSSNLQGAATLVGDTTSIMLGGYADMNFVEFFIFQRRPSMFFATEVGALSAAVLLLIIFRKENAPVEATERTVVTDWVPTYLLGGTVIALIIASFIPNTPKLINGIICMSFMIIGLIYKAIRNKSIKSLGPTLKEIDYQTILLLMGIFVIVGGISEQGLIAKIAEIFTKISGGNVFLIYTIVVWFSVLISAFIDNIPYVATMLPVMQGIGATLGISPIVLYFGLLSGATLGGNLTPVGASANITAIGMLRKEGYEVKNKDFLKIGVPFTLAAIIPAYIFIWLCYGL